MIISLSGYRQSGKTTTANILKTYFPSHYNIYELNFADILKDITLEIFDKLDPNGDRFTIDDLSQQNIKEHKYDINWGHEKLTFRRMLLDIALMMKKVDPNIWVTPVINKIKSYHKEKLVSEKNIYIVGDVRFLNEADALENLSSLLKICHLKLHIINNRQINNKSQVNIPKDIQIEELTKKYNYIDIYNNLNYDDLESNVIKYLPSL